MKKWKIATLLLLILCLAILTACQRVNKVGWTDEGYLLDDRKLAKSFLEMHEIFGLTKAPDISTSHISNVPLSLAIGKGYQAMLNYDESDARTIGYDFPLSTVYQPENYTRQLVDGHLYWIALLGFKKFDNQAAYQQMGGVCPGIVVVDAEDETKSAKVMLRNAEGKPYKIELHFRDVNWDDNFVGRYLYNKGYGKMPYWPGCWNWEPYLDDITPEVEDGTWNVYYTCTVNEKSIRLSGGDRVCPMIKKILVVDAQSKEIKSFDKPEQVPDWIDRIYSEQVMAEYLNSWGYNLDNYKIYSDKGKIVLDDNALDVVLSSDGKQLVYVGVMTSAQNDNSATGLVIIPTRSLKGTYYHLPTPYAIATRNHAQQVINAQNDYRGWTVEDLTIHWLYGRLTWEGSYVKPIKFSTQAHGENQEGETSGDTMVGSTYMACVLTPADCDMSGSKVVWDIRKQVAFDMYENMVFVTQTSNVGSFTLEENEANGRIVNMKQLTDGGQTVYFFNLEEKKYAGLIFSLRIRSLYDRDTMDIIASKDGDHVSFVYGDTKNSPTCFVKKFHNINNPSWKAR